RGSQVLLECPAALAGLFSRGSGIDQIVPQGSELPPFDVYVPLLSLPRILGTRLKNVPAEVPYLVADPALVDEWQRRVDAIAGRKVGIAWQGNPQHRGDKRRSMPLR